MQASANDAGSLCRKLVKRLFSSPILVSSATLTAHLASCFRTVQVLTSTGIAVLV